jgi:glycosyltransferase involved in cell wall biosynthesis
MRISVVVTCFNLEAYVGEAISSILAQDIAGSLEIIVVDDCSTDGSAAVIQRFEQVRYLRTSSNDGVLLAMIAGIDAATGDILCFMDGDDLWEPDKLSRVAALYRAQPGLGFVTHDLRFIDAGGAPLARRSRPEVEMALISPQKWDSALREGILSLADFIWLGSAFSVRPSAIGIDGFVAFARALPDPRNCYQDWPLAFWCAARGARFGYIPAKLFRYRLHGANHSGDARTAERATRNLRRTLNTLLAMRDIAGREKVRPPYRANLDERIGIANYQLDLNAGRRLSALRGLIRGARNLRRRRLLAKELARFAGIQLLGAERFARLAARRTLFRDLPPS